MKMDNASNREANPMSGNRNFLQNTIEILGKISSMIIAPGGNTDFAIDEALARSGHLLAASRVYVMQDEKSGNYLRNTHEWVNDNIGSVMFSWPLYDYDYDLPSLKQELESKAVFFGHAAELPKDINNVLIKQGVKSMMLAPLFRDGKRIGIVGCDFCDAEAKFCDEYILLLQNLAGLISIALERKQYQIIRNKLNAVRSTIADVEHILDGVETVEAIASRPARPVSLQDAERRLIIETLELYNGNKLKAAKHLGLTWPSLDRRCKKMGIEVRKR